MILKYKLHNPLATPPQRVHKTDAGFDLVAVNKESTHLYNEYDTGVSVFIPEGYVGLVYPRSSISTTGMQLANSVGVIDAGYRGTIKLRFRRNDNGVGREYEQGEKVGQLVIIKLEVDGVEEVKDGEENSTDRGSEGFGSSGR